MGPLVEIFAYTGERDHIRSSKGNNVRETRDNILSQNKDQYSLCVKATPALTIVLYIHT